MDEAYTMSTLQDFITAGEDDELTHYNTSILELAGDNLEVPVSNIIENDYLNELRELAVNFEFTDADFATYKYKPHLLSLVLYDTPELYFVILALNDMVSKKDFDQRKIKLLTKDTMLDVINLITNAQEDYIEDNRESLYDAEEKAGLFIDDNDEE